MSTGYLMSLDVGGGGGRCLIVDVENGETWTAFHPWRFPADPEAGEWSFKVDTDAVWRTLGEVVKEVIAKSGIQANNVIGVAASSMRHGMVVIGPDGETIMARSNMDARAVNQSMEIAGRHGDFIYQRTGHWPSPIMPAPALSWMAAEMPQAMQKVRAVMSLSDWVAFRLCGNIAYEATQAAESLLFDLVSQTWAEDLITAFEIPSAILPRVVRAGERVGTLGEYAAKHLGLVAGIPVAAGGADTQSGLLGLGVISPGQVGVVAGTTTPIMMVHANATIDPEKRLWTSVHILPGRYVLESNAGSMGKALEWFANALYSDLPEPVGALIAEANLVPPGAEGIYSTLGVNVFNAGAMGLPLDTFTFSTANRDPSEAGRAALARAALEGMAYAVKANLQQILAVADSEAKEIFVGGGMSRGGAWTQIISDLLGKAVGVGAAEATALGAAICAGVGAGLYTDLSAGAQSLAKLTQKHEPGEARRTYQSLYQDWQDLRQSRREADDLAASMITQALPTASVNRDSPRRTEFRPRIYISADMGESALSVLRELGDVTYASYREGTMLVGEELVETLQDYQVFVTEVDVVDAEALQGLPDLRMIASCRGNPVNVDIEACTAAGVPVVNTPGRNADAVADLTIAFMLMLARKLQDGTAFLRLPGGEAGDMGRMGQAYFKYQGDELWGKTIGLIGAGAIGRKVIKRLLPFDTKILVYDPYISDGAATLMGAKKVSLEVLLQSSDVISLHAPVTDETRNLLDKTRLELIKPGAYLVNTARAALVDEAALIEALKTGILAGAALDVFRVEPPGADDPLLALDNVIVTPHLGGNTRQVGAHQGMIVAGELRLLLAGKKPLHILNPEVIDGFSWTGERHSSEAMLEKLAEGPGPSVSDLVQEGSDRQSPQTVGKLTEAAPDDNKAADITGSEKSGGLFSRIFRRKGVHEVDDKSSAPVQGVDRSDSAEKMERIVQRFVSSIGEDEALSKFARGKELVMLFTIKDLDRSFYLSFLDDSLKTAMGNPPGEPHVRLKMDAEILDGMFTGRISGNKAAMTGKLSFSGDTRKAMSLMRIQNHLTRLYTTAREEVGDPGDLTRLRDSGAPPSPIAVMESSTGSGESSAQHVIMRKILEQFVANIRTDEKMVEASRGKNLVMHFTVKDLDQTFYLSFVDGEMQADLGEPATSPHVRLKMNTEILDGMFTGRISGNKAAMTGKLSFSGDTRKAMAFQRFQKDMSRLYQAAREQIGDPGDLAQLRIQPAAAPLANTGAETYAPAAPAVVKVGDIRDEILQITNELYTKGLITATGGNISARTDENPEHVWITPSAIFKGDLRADMMVRINLDGELVGDNDLSASSERRVHCAIYRQRPEINAVIHSHAPQATIMALAGIKFLPISTEAAFIGDVPVAPFIMPGSDELGDLVAEALGSGVAVIMQNHGLVVAGSSLRRAADMTEVVEVTAEKILTCKAVGIDPQLLPDDILEELREMGQMLV